MAQNSNLNLLSSSDLEAWLCRQLEAARLQKNVNQTQLANEAGVSRRTISRLENGQGVSLDTFIRVMRALDLGDRFADLIPDASIRPIDRVNQKDTQRKRASSPRGTQSVAETKWEWGDQ